MSLNPRAGILVTLLLVTGSSPFGRAAEKDIDPAGRPAKFEAGKKKAIAVYHDDGAWHIRVTSPKGGRTQFKGAVKVTGDKLSGNFQGLEKAKQAKDADWIKPDLDGRGFVFQFAVFGKVDAVKFKVGPKAESVSFSIQVDGDDDPKVVFIGSKGVHPEKAKFTLEAHPSESSTKPAPKTAPKNK